MVPGARYWVQSSTGTVQYLQYSRARERWAGLDWMVGVYRTSTPYDVSEVGIVTPPPSSPLSQLQVEGFQLRQSRASSSAQKTPLLNLESVRTDARQHADLCMLAMWFFCARGSQRLPQLRPDEDQLYCTSHSTWHSGRSQGKASP